MRLLIFVVTLSAFAIHAQSTLLVAAVDLSKTEKAIGYSGKSEFEENVRTVSELLAQLPVSSQVMIVGITSRSYISPAVLLSAKISADPGVFSSALASGRRDLVAEWKKRARALQPSFSESDVVGAVRFAGEVFERSAATRKTLLVLSDSRNFTKELDLESPKTIDIRKSLTQVDKQHLFANLGGVEVIFLGIGDHSGKRDNTYTSALRTFWSRYVQQSGGVVRLFSTTRDPETVGNIATALP